MREFNYKQYVADVLDKEVLDLLTSIYAKKGVVEYFINSNPELVKGYAEITKVQNAISAVRQRGHLGLSAKTVFEWVEKIKSNCGSDVEFCWNLINNWNCEDNINDFSFTREFVVDIGNEFKKKDRIGRKIKYRETDYSYNIRNCSEDEHKDFTFNTVLSDDIEDYLDKMIEGVNEVIKEGLNPLLYLPMFWVDFLKVSPFKFDNERTAYLLMLKLLSDENFESMKYISLIRFLEENRYELFSSFEKSLEGWEHEINDYKPIVVCFLKIVLKMYEQSEEQIVPFYTQKMNKQEKIEHIIFSYGTAITKTEIRWLIPDVSFSSVENVLTKLHKEHYLYMCNGGRAAAYLPSNCDYNIRYYYE